MREQTQQLGGHVSNLNELYILCTQLIKNFALRLPSKELPES